MCGIIGYVGESSPQDVLIDGLRRLEYRGYDSAGIAILDTNHTDVFRSAGRINALEEKIGTHQFQGFLGIGHTRWATHGAPTENNAHPHQIGAITLVHNGIIENYNELKEEMVLKGRVIQSETDTEIVAHLFDEQVQNGKTLTECLSIVLPRLVGSYAFVLISDREPNTLIGVRNGAPLLVGLGQNENYLASDVQAILHRTRRIIYLKDKQYAICRAATVQVGDINGAFIQPEIKTVTWTSEQCEKGGYSHFMLKEIHEQSRAIAMTLEGIIDHRDNTARLTELDPFLDRLQSITRIQIAACGTARHASLVAKYYLEALTRLPVEVDFASEFRYRNPILDKNTLTIFISQSGETADTLAALKEAKKHDTLCLSVCNVRDSSLARESDIVLYTNAGPEIGVASTKAFTTQLEMLHLLAIHLANVRGNLSPETLKRLSADLIHLPLLVDQALELEPAIEAIAEKYYQTKFFFFIGRGVQFPIALEGALKLKEISYIHTEGYPAGELKHGPIALIDSDTVIVVISPKDKKSDLIESPNLYDKMMSNLQEVKSRGGKIIGIGTEGDAFLARESNDFIGLPQSTWNLNPILTTIPLQLLAYYIAVKLGTDVDKPRNLAKSVTVE